MPPSTWMAVRVVCCAPSMAVNSAAAQAKRQSGRPLSSAAAAYRAARRALSMAIQALASWCLIAW
ncbi:hypothetical protein D3C80_1980100 [compost metagenome]